MWPIASTVRPGVPIEARTKTPNGLGVCDSTRLVAESNAKHCDQAAATGHGAAQGSHRAPFRATRDRGAGGNPPSERGPRPASDAGVRSAGGLPGAGGVAQAAAAGDVQGPRRHGRRRRGGRVRRRARDGGAAHGQPGPGRAGPCGHGGRGGRPALPAGRPGARGPRADVRLLRARDRLGCGAGALPAARAGDAARGRPARGGGRLRASRPPDRDEPAARHRQAGAAARLPGLSRRRSTRGRRRPRRASTRSAASSASTTRSSAACSHAAGGCRSRWRP